MLDNVEPMKKWAHWVIRLPIRFHFWGSFAIMLLVTIVMTAQIVDRRDFASSTLHDDVMERWGAPIVQPEPSIRYVESGSVFNNLHALPFDSQDIAINAAMNYRKRGLIYFSGFDFDFHGRYVVKNDRGKDLDVVFVFPINLEKNKVLLSEFAFLANGEKTKIDLTETSDKLVWTGRVADGQQLSFDILFKGRGLDQFTYLLDPALPVRNFHLAFGINGGDNFDYADGVVPATASELRDGQAKLEWSYASLESGVPVGVILPSEKAFDDLIATMLRRSWATFILFFLCIAALAVYYKKDLAIYESYLISACFAFFYVLLAYFAAYMNFFLAYILSLAISGTLIHLYVRKTIGAEAGVLAMGLVGAFLFVPTLAVILVGYTGLIYALEILAGLAVLMFLTARRESRSLVDGIISAAGTAAVALFLVLGAPGTARADEGTATLPLSEILRLHRASETTAKVEVPRPPVATSINKLELSGRLLDEAVEINAHVEIAVLSDGEWVSVPIIHKDAKTNISQLPSVTGGAFAIHGGKLAFVTDKKGVYAFDIAIMKTAELDGRKRKARLEFEEATLAVMLVQFDEGLFSLARSGAAAAAKKPEGVLIYPEKGEFVLTWEQIAAIAQRKTEEEKRPPVESVIESAHGTTVSTLEGKQIVRVSYVLRFEGTKPIDFTLPEGLALEKVYLNRVAIPFKVEGRALHLEVAPARAGDGSGRLELVMTTPKKNYYLSGTIGFVLPGVSWPVNELYVDVFLPQVFNYSWTGGSLAPVETAPAVEYTYTVPTPGKKLSFHQYLISSSMPAFDVAYTVDLQGQYFRAR